jgi:pimeloyl-ACP methyl ester carboxylesterase
LAKKSDRAMTILRNALTSLPAFGKTYRPHAKAPKLEIVSRVPSLARAAPPVLFIHGTWHAAWCWSEHFLDYFAANGFAAYALSLRGHGASEGHGRLRFVRVRDFVQDIASVAASLPAAPVLVGHSMGGFLVQKFLEEREAPAAVLMASAPPTGVWPMFARLVRDHPIDVIKSNLKFSLWPIISDPDRARRMLFSSAMPSEEVSRFHRLLQDDSVFGYLDSLMFDLVATERVSSPVLVMGAGDDVMVTAKEIDSTASAYGVKPIVFEGLAHDMMLDCAWRTVADKIISELDARFPERRAGDERPGAVAA